MIRFMVIHFTVETVVDYKFMKIKLEARGQLGAIAIMQVRSHVASIEVIMKIERKLRF